jgi:hypothetical protein
VVVKVRRVAERWGRNESRETILEEIDILDEHGER